MERFFRVEAGSPVDLSYWEWKQEAKHVREVIHQFFTDNNIESNFYSFKKYGSYGEPCTSGNERKINLGIVPTEKDLEAFESMLRKDVIDDIRFFKQRSKIRKEFAKLAIENQLRDLMKPAVSGYNGFYYCNHLASKSRLFDFEGVVYGSVESEKIREPNIEGIIEILGSEFYKIIEQIDSKKNGGTENGEN